MLLEAPQVLLVPGLNHFSDQSGGGEEAKAVTALASCQIKRQGDVRFAGAAVAEQQDVFLEVGCCERASSRTSVFLSAGKSGFETICQRSRSEARLYLRLAGRVYPPTSSSTEPSEFGIYPVSRASTRAYPHIDFANLH